MGILAFSARAAMGVALAVGMLLVTVLPAAAAAHASSNPGEITAVGSRASFAATTAAHGRELWVSDGTTAGTHIVKNIVYGGASSNPSDLTANGLLYFSARDGNHGRELRVSDGTARGTHMVLDINPG